MSRKDEKEWDELWGNALLSEYQLKSKILILLFNTPRGLSPNDIYKEIYETASGQPLEDSLNRVFTELSDDGFIKEVKNFGLQLSGKGLKICKSPVRLLRKYPYETWYWLKKLDLLITKYLPIIFSSIALIISFLNYIKK